jgi:hypothetical protein
VLFGGSIKYCFEGIDPYWIRLIYFNWIALCIRGTYRQEYKNAGIQVSEELVTVETQSNEGTDLTKGSYGFIFAIVSHLRWGLLKTILPRLALIGFSYAQPFLITAAIDFLDVPVAQRNINYAYGLVGATALLYFSIAVSSSSGIDIKIRLHSFQSFLRHSTTIASTDYSQCSEEPLLH